MEIAHLPRTVGALTALAATLVLADGTLVTPALADGGRTRFTTSAVADGHGHATVPPHTGASHIPGVGSVSVSFILLDTSSGDVSSRLGGYGSQPLGAAEDSG